MTVRGLCRMQEHLQVTYERHVRQLYDCISLFKGNPGQLLTAIVICIIISLETEYRLFPPVTIFLDLFPCAGYFFNASD